MSCRGVNSYIVGGISRDRDFLSMLFSFAVSVTNYDFPSICHNSTTTPVDTSWCSITATRRLSSISTTRSVSLVERLRRRNRYIAQLASSCRGFPSDPRLSLIVPFHVQDDLVMFSDLVYAATLICPRLDPRPACLDDLVDFDDIVEYLPVCSLCDRAT